MFFHTISAETRAETFGDIRDNLLNTVFCHFCLNCLTGEALVWLCHRLFYSTRITFINVFHHIIPLYNMVYNSKPYLKANTLQDLLPHP